MQRSWFAIPVLLSALAMPACDGSSPTELAEARRVTVVALGETFILAIGDDAIIRPSGAVLTFVELVSEGRCPSDVNCVQAGEAVIHVRLRLADGQVETLPVITPGRGNYTARAGGLVVELLDLEPYPISIVPSPPLTSYRAKLLVTAG